MAEYSKQALADLNQIEAYYRRVAGPRVVEQFERRFRNTGPRKQTAGDRASSLATSERSRGPSRRLSVQGLLSHPYGRLDQSTPCSSYVATTMGKRVDRATVPSSSSPSPGSLLSLRLGDKFGFTAALPLHLSPFQPSPSVDPIQHVRRERVACRQGRVHEIVGGVARHADPFHDAARAMIAGRRE